MNTQFFENQVFDKIDFTQSGLPKGDYEDCTFKNCTLESVDLSEIQFTECTFIECNLALIKCQNTQFQQVKFMNCKLVGVDFSTCDKFLLAFSFEHCVLNLASFYELIIPNSKFDNCTIQEADFRQANLEGAVFAKCDLSRAIFERTNLHKVNLRTSYNYKFDLDKNDVSEAEIDVAGLIELVSKYGLNIY